MYCDECHKQSPDNFVTCAYCGAKLKSHKKKPPSKFVKKKRTDREISLKSVIAILVAFATVLGIAAVLTASITGAKSENVVETFVKAVRNEDEELYYSLYDEYIKEYNKNNRYFADDETYAQMVLPVKESSDFYVQKCGEEYELSYEITQTTSLDETELQRFKDLLSSRFGYVELPSKVDILNVSIHAEGETGEYTSVYNDFWCMKIKGKWYIVDSAISTEYMEKTS